MLHSLRYWLPHRCTLPRYGHCWFLYTLLHSTLPTHVGYLRSPVTVDVTRLDVVVWTVTRLHFVSPFAHIYGWLPICTPFVFTYAHGCCRLRLRFGSTLDCWVTVTRLAIAGWLLPRLLPVGCRLPLSVARTVYGWLRLLFDVWLVPVVVQFTVDLRYPHTFTICCWLVGRLRLRYVGAFTFLCYCDSRLRLRLLVVAALRCCIYRLRLVLPVVVGSWLWPVGYSPLLLTIYVVTLRLFAVLI